jgi:PAS domain S-box-containing protein
MPRPVALRISIFGLALAVLVTLYGVAWSQHAWWPSLLPIALLYLLPVTLAALHYGWRDGWILAGIAVLTLVPLVWRGFRLGHGPASALGFGLLVPSLLGWATLSGRWTRRRVLSEIASDSNLESATLRVRQLATLNDIGQTVLSSLELDVTLSLIMDRVQEALSAESGSLMLIEDRKLVFHTSFGPVSGELTPQNKLELGQGIVGWVALTGESVLVKDARQDPRHLTEFDRKLDYEARSILCVPLKEAENRILGVIEVINPLNQEVFSKQDRELLESIATFAATAIQNARLYQQTLRYVTDLYALYEVGKEISSTLTIDEIMKVIAIETIRLTSAARSQIALVDEPTKRVTAMVQVGFGNSAQFEPSLEVIVDDETDTLTQQERYNRILQGLCGYALQEKASTMTDNLRRDDRLRELDLDKAVGPHAQSMMSAPLLLQGKPVGTLCAIRLDDAEPFGDRELGVLNMLSGQASIAIENAHNFEDRQRRIVELGTLNETGQALSSTLRKDDLSQLIYSQVARVMDARTFYIALYDAARDQISFPLAYEQGICQASPATGPNSEEWLPRRGRKGLTEHVLQTRKPLYLPDKMIARMTELGIEQIGHPCLSWLGVPILWDDQPLGIIAVQSFDRENAYDEAQVQLLMTLASQAAVAMRNAQLFDEVNRMTENLESLVADRTEALAQANRDLTMERDRLNALYRIMRELSNSLELERLLNRTLVLINHALTAEQGCILIRDSGNSLVYRAVVGRTPHNREGEPLPLPRLGEWVRYREDQGLIGRLMSRPNSILINDLAATPQWETSPNQSRWQRSVLAAPLLSGEETRGCILLYHRAADHFTHDHQRMLEAIASQIAVTVGSLEIFDLLSESADRLGTMLRLQQLEAAKSQAILEGVADGVMVTDASGRITLFNAAAERILHISREDVKGLSESELPGLFGLTGTTWAELARSWSDAQADPNQNALYQERIEYERRVISIHIAPVYRQDVFEGIVSVFRDITRDVEVDRMKSEFISTVSHELRTPMTSIKGYIDLMYGGMAGPLNEPQLKFLSTVKENADRLTLLVNSLLDISRLDTGMIKLAIEPVAPLDVIGQVVSILSPKAEAKGQSLTVLAQRPQPMVRADPGRVIQILTNLVDNAIKYTPSGGRIAIDTQCVDGFLHVQVQDDGMGISEPDQEKLFSRFFRAESALMSGAGGAGLGLHITRSLIDLHGGSIWVESRPKHGSTFTFSLPLAESAQDARDENQFKTISYARADQHVLIVEDDADLAHQLSHHLRGLGGYRVHVSRYGHAALNHVREPSNRVDLIVVDLHVPDMNGDELVCQLKQEPRTEQVPLVAIATSTESGSVERSQILELGATRFVGKPLHVPELVAEMERALAESNASLVEHK